MPVMDGITATSRILELRTPGEPYAPIIGVTAHALESDKDKCLKAGMDDYLTKPVRQEMLVEKLDQWVRGKTAQQAQSA